MQPYSVFHRHVTLGTAFLYAICPCKGISIEMLCDGNPPANSEGDSCGNKPLPVINVQASYITSLIIMYFTQILRCRARYRAVLYPHRQPAARYTCAKSNTTHVLLAERAAMYLSCPAAILQLQSLLVDQADPWPCICSCCFHFHRMLQHLLAVSKHHHHIPV